MTTLIKRKAARTPLDPWGSILGSLTTGVSPKALRASASSDVTAQIKAAAAANAAAVAGQKIAFENQGRRASGFATALANLTKPDTAAIVDQYRQSADRLRGFGTGLTGAVADAQQAQADKNAADVSRVTGGLGSVASYDIPNMRNVAQMLGVVMPATSLEERGLNSIADANATYASQVGGIGSIAQEYMQKGSDLDSEVAAKNAALQASRPSLFNEALKAAQENARSNIATSIQSRYLVDSLRKSGADITGIDPYTGKPTAQTKAQRAAAKAAAKAAKAANIPIFDATRSNAKGYEVDQFGNPINGVITPLPGYRRNKAGTGVVKIPTKGKGSSGANMQSKTINGNIVLFDPGTKSYYLPGDTKNPIDPNTLKGKVDAVPLPMLRAKAASGIAAALDPNAKEPGDPKTLPRIIFARGVASGVPGWVMAEMLRQEALRHPDDVAWQNVLKKNWVAGPRKKRK
jgi:hypothetical protein